MENQPSERSSKGRRTQADDGRIGLAASRQSLKVWTVGVPAFQVAISEETSDPSLKSTRSQPAADHVWTENPAAGVAATSCTDVAATSSVTWPPVRV